MPELEVTTSLLVAEISEHLCIGFMMNFMYALFCGLFLSVCFFGFEVFLNFCF